MWNYLIKNIDATRGNCIIAGHLMEKCQKRENCLIAGQLMEKCQTRENCKIAAHLMEKYQWDIHLSLFPLIYKLVIFPEPILRVLFLLNFHILTRNSGFPIADSAGRSVCVWIEEKQGWYAGRERHGDRETEEKSLFETHFFARWTIRFAKVSWYDLSSWAIDLRSGLGLS